MKGILYKPMNRVGLENQIKKFVDPKLLAWVKNSNNKSQSKGEKAGPRKQTKNQSRRLSIE